MLPGGIRSSKYPDAFELLLDCISVSSETRPSAEALTWAPEIGLRVSTSRTRPETTTDEGAAPDTGDNSTREAAAIATSAAMATIRVDMDLTVQCEGNQPP